MKEELTLLLKLLFVRLFSHWINGHVSQASQQKIMSYAWPGLISFFLLLILAALIEVKLKTRVETLACSRVESNRPRPLPIHLNSRAKNASIPKTLGTKLGSMVFTLRKNYLLKIEPFRIEGHNSLRIFLLICIVALLFAAMGHWPYDFYVLMRLAIFATCVIQFFAILGKQRTAWAGTIFIVALLYNPLFPIHLHRSTWESLNWVTLAIFSVLCGLLKPANRLSSSPPLFSSTQGLATESAETHTTVLAAKQASRARDGPKARPHRKAQLPRDRNKKAGTPKHHE